MGLTAFLGLATGMWFGEVDDMVPRLWDFLPHLCGALLGALVGTLWTRVDPKRTHMTDLLLVAVVFVLPILLVLAYVVQASVVSLFRAVEL